MFVNTKHNILAVIIFLINAINTPIKASEDFAIINDLNYEINSEQEKSIKSFVIYYGKLKDDIIYKLSKYETVILEPRNAKRNQIIKLKELGCKVLGYTSVIEQNENSIDFKSLKNDWFYKVNGRKLRNDRWQSWYMDIRNRGYQNFLMEQIFFHIVNKELDGVFLDTVGDIDDLNWKEKDKREMREAYRDFLKRIKTNYKDLKIVQNWGFQTAKEYSYEYLDGIMWEGFTFDILEKDEWSKNRFKEINDMKLDFYIVAPYEEKIDNIIFNKDIYLFVRNSEVYDELD